jgi:hypothetical protein
VSETLAPDIIIRLDDQRVRQLIAELVIAAISMDDHGGLGSDEVRRIAREIKQMQEVTVGRRQSD